VRDESAAVVYAAAALFPEVNHGHEEAQAQARAQEGKSLPDEEEKEGRQSMLIYRCPGHHAGPSGTTYDFKGVDGPCPDGWHMSLADAVAAAKGEKPASPAAPPASAPAPAAPDPTPDARPSRVELEAEAAKLGIRVDGRWSDARLAERILEADAKPTED
jgi:hypothetical protein